MSKSKKPRKAYRPTPRPESPRAFMVAIRGAHLLCAHDQLTRAARVRSSVEMLGASTGGVPQWRDVFDALNMIEAFAHMGLVRFERVHRGAPDFNRRRDESPAVDRLKRAAAERAADAARPGRHLGWVLAIVTCREYFHCRGAREAQGGAGLGQRFAWVCACRGGCMKALGLDLLAVGYVAGCLRRSSSLACV